ncbi:MAG: hypothetical protein EXQ70_06140 [Solirubrobacterales bacterium]|nr:hypothetical protein [Solirubrobacterales bacterium]
MDSAATPKPSEPSDRGTGRLLLANILHLGVLWSFAVAKPLFDVLEGDPAFFVARDNTSADIIIFALALTILPPLAMVALEASVSRWRQVARNLHLAFVALLVAVLALQLIKGVSEGPALLVVLLAIATGAAFAVLYARGEFLKAVLTVLSPIPVIFIALFLFTGSVSALVNPDPVPDESARTVESDAPVVEVVFDEFPLASLLDASGHIDASRYPGFAELARSSTWYPRVSSVAAFTHLAVPAILTGRSRAHSRLPTAARHPKNLFTVLDGHREMNVYESVTRLCPEDECGTPRRDPFWERARSLWTDLSAVEGEKVLPADYAKNLPVVDQGFGHFLDFDDVPEDIAAYQDFLDGMDSDNPSQLSFFHALLPHLPWHLLPDGHLYTDTFNPAKVVPGDSSEWQAPPAVIRYFWERHLLQVGYADRMVQQLIGRLKRLGIWKRALVVVTADHGSSFYPSEPRRDATPGNAAAILRTPLFIKAPAQTRGRIDDAPICSSDILPKVGGLLGLQPPIGPTACAPATAVTYSAGKYVTVRRSLIDQRFESLLREQARLFEPGGGWGAVYGSGDSHHLVGRRVDDLPNGSRLGVTADLGEEGDQRSYRPDEQLAEVLVSAELSGRVQPGKPVAIAVGGRVEVIGVSYELDGSFGVLGVLPPRSLNRGRISLLWIEPGTPPTLRPIPSG